MLNEGLRFQFQFHEALLYLNANIRALNKIKPHFRAYDEALQSLKSAVNEIEFLKIALPLLTDGLRQDSSLHIWTRISVSKSELEMLGELSEPEQKLVTDLANLRNRLKLMLRAIYDYRGKKNG